MALPDWDTYLENVSGVTFRGGEAFLPLDAALEATIGDALQEGPERVEGAWYRDLTPENAERVIQEHLLGGRVVGFDVTPLTLVL